MRKGCCGHMRCVRSSDQKEEEPRPRVHSRPRRARQPSGGRSPATKGSEKQIVRRAARTPERRNLKQQRKHRTLHGLSLSEQTRKGTTPFKRKQATLATPATHQEGQGDGREARLHSAAP